MVSAAAAFSAGVCVVARGGQDRVDGLAHAHGRHGDIERKAAHAFAGNTAGIISAWFCATFAGAGVTARCSMSSARGT